MSSYIFIRLNKSTKYADNIKVNIYANLAHQIKKIRDFVLIVQIFMLFFFVFSTFLFLTFPFYFIIFLLIFTLLNIKRIMTTL